MRTNTTRTAPSKTAPSRPVASRTVRAAEEAPAARTPERTPLLGIDHPAILAATVNGSERLRLRARLATDLAERLEGAEGAKLMFAGSGAVAFDSALRVARAYTGRGRVIRHDGSLDALLARIEDDATGPLAAVLIDGLVPIAEAAELRKLADTAGFLVVGDEQAGGFARSGRWFSTARSAAQPDLILLGDDIVPAVLVSDRVAERIRSRYFSAVLVDEVHPIAAAVALATIAAIEREGLLERAAMLGEQLVRRETAHWLERHPSLGGIDGDGLRWRLRFREPGNEVLATFLSHVRRAELWPNHAGDIAEFAPPLTVSESLLLRGIRIIDGALTATDRRIGHQTIRQAA